MIVASQQIHPDQVLEDSQRHSLKRRSRGNSLSGEYTKRDQNKLESFSSVDDEVTSSADTDTVEYDEEEAVAAAAAIVEETRAASEVGVTNTMGAQ